MSQASLHIPSLYCYAILLKGLLSSYNLKYQLVFFFFWDFKFVVQVLYLVFSGLRAREIELQRWKGNLTYQVFHVSCYLDFAFPVQKIWNKSLHTDYLCYKRKKNVGSETHVRISQWNCMFVARDDSYSTVLFTLFDEADCFGDCEANISCQLDCIWNKLNRNLLGIPSRYFLGHMKRINKTQHKSWWHLLKGANMKRHRRRILCVGLTYLISHWQVHLLASETYLHWYYISTL